MYQAIMPFHPQFASKQISVTASSVTWPITPSTASSAGSIRIVNSGTSILYFTIGDTDSVTTSASTGIAMLPNTAETFYIRTGNRFIALMGSSAGNTAYVSFGESA